MDELISIINKIIDDLNFDDIVGNIHDNYSELLKG